jgi:hypothetical protein
MNDEENKAEQTQGRNHPFASMHAPKQSHRSPSTTPRPGLILPSYYRLFFNANIHFSAAPNGPVADLEGTRGALCKKEPAPHGLFKKV